MSRIYVAPLNWQSPGWDVGYFPEDIPADWKLAFYANDFAVVVLNEDCWSKPQCLADFVSQLDELEDDQTLLIYAIANALPTNDLIESLNASLGNRLDGMLVKDMPAEHQLNELDAQLRSRVILPWPACAAAANSQLGNQLGSQFDSQWESHCWCWLEQLADLPAREQGSAQLPAVVLLEKQQDLRNIRRYLERLQIPDRREADGGRLLLLVDNPEGSAEFLQQLRTLLELMGIA